MNIYGLTPIDAALAAWGLVCSQELMDFLFVQRGWGVLALAMGFCWSIWQSAREANFKHFAIFVFIALTGIFLFIIPKHQQPIVKSAVEVYGVGPTITAQSLKDSQTQSPTMPLILSFIAQMTDSLSFGAISKVDASFHDQLGFLNNPFGIQKLSLETHQVLHSPLPDLKLRQDIEDFNYAFYLPSLKMYINSKPSEDLNSLWMGDSNIVYSSQGDHQWQSIQSRLIKIIKDPQGPWIKIIDIFSQWKTNEDDMNHQMMASLIRGQLGISQKSSWLRVAESIQTIFPYIYGWANFCLYASFPLLMLAVVIIRKMSLFLQYIEMFLWIKSWILCAAVSFYVSLVALQVQAKTSSHINWFWDYPYYVIVSSSLLVLMPILSLLAIHRSFQLINHH